MKPGFWIAQRFSFARKRFRIINVISAISLAGIILGVTTLLVVMSVLNGFQKLARDLFTSIDSPVQLVGMDGQPIKVSDTLLQAIRKLDGVGSAEPFSEGEAIISTNDKSELIIVKGLSDASHLRLMRLTHAKHPLFTSETIAVGELLAYRINLYHTREVKLFSPELISLGLESLSQPYLTPSLTISQATVHSLFSLQKIFDDRYVLTSNQLARKILLQGIGSCTGIELRGVDGESPELLAGELRRWLATSSLKSTCRVRTLEEKYSNIFAVMQLEKWASFTILMLVVVVAALSLTGALAMTAIDKQRELFYLRCLGMEKQEFIAIFMLQGGATGITGTVIGIIFAFCICILQQLYGFVQLPSKGAFIINAYPVSMQPLDFFVVSLATIVLSFAVGLYPARKAALIAASGSLDMKTD